MGFSRKVQLTERIKEIISSILLSEMQDPRMGFTTVLGVELSGDLRQAKVKVSVLGDDQVQAVTLNALQHAQSFVQKLLGERLKIRFVPLVTFELDDSVKRSIRLSQVLRESRGDEKDDGVEDEQ